MNNLILSSKDLSSLITTTYIWALIIAGIGYGIILLIANMIAFEGGKNPKDPQKRKIWFYIIGFISLAGFFIYHYILVMTMIRNPAFKSQFLTHIIISSLVTVAIYYILVFLTSKLFKKSKIATIFPSK